MSPVPPVLPATFPLATVGLDDAVARQFRLLEATAAHFEGQQLFSSDAGVVPGLGRPRTTARVEAVLADFFGAQDAAFVQGAGTGAIRAALNAAVRAGDPLLIHRAPVYRTTEVTLRGIGVDTVEADFNDAGRSARPWGPAGSGGRTSSTPGSGSRTPTIRPRSSPPAGPPGFARSWTTTTP